MYLVQRCTVKVSSYNNEKISDYVALDYMGAAEFEFGAIPTSIREMNKKDLEIFRFDWGTFAIHILCEKGQLDKIKEDLSKYLANQKQFKESISLRDIVNNKKTYRDDDFWWEVDKHFAFSLSKTKVVNFQKALKKSLEFMDNKKKGV